MFIFNQFKKLKFWIEFDHGRSMIGLLIGLITFILLNSISNILLLNIFISVIISFVSMIFIQKRNVDKFGENYEEFNRKDRYIDPNELRGFSKNIDQILDLDKELQELKDIATKYDYSKLPKDI